MNGKTVTTAPSDTALMVLIRLTAQQPVDYNFSSLDAGLFLRKVIVPEFEYGFKDTKTRKEAIKKFRAWWKKHKNDKPYKDLKPIEIP